MKEGDDTPAEENDHHSASTTIEENPLSPRLEGVDPSISMGFCPARSAKTRHPPIARGVVITEHVKSPQEPQKCPLLGHPCSPKHYTPRRGTTSQRHRRSKGNLGYFNSLLKCILSVRSRSNDHHLMLLPVNFLC
jgi:hypothetical protein